MSDPKAQRFVSNLVSSAKGLMFPKAEKLAPQQIKLMARAPLKKNKKKRQKGKGRMNVPMNSVGQTSITISVDVVTPIATSGTSGTRVFAVFLGYKNTNYDWDFQSSTQLVALMNAFQFSTVLQAEFKWVPTVAYTTTGAVGLAINPDVTSNSGPGSFQTLLQGDISNMSDIKENFAIRYRAANEEDNEAKYNKDSTAVAASDRRFYAANILWVRFESNVTTDAVTIGYVAQTYTIRLERLV